MSAQIIRITEEEDLYATANEALDYYLYVSGWQAANVFYAILDKRLTVDHLRMAMLYENGVPVAWVMYWLRSHSWFGPSEAGDMWRFTKMEKDSTN